MKLIKNINMICFNIRRPHAACLSSIPKNGQVEEYKDRYHYWVEHGDGKISEMTVYKHETISVEILYKSDVN